jgi:hypothetical protein
MPESCAAGWAAAWADGASRFNMTHAPAGSATGGEFASSGGGSGSAKGKPGGAHPPSAAAKARLARKAHLQARAKADRDEAHLLGTQLDALEKQHAAAVKQAKASAATSKKQTAAAKGKHTAKTTAKKSTVTHKQAAHHASLVTRITGLRTRIVTLLTQADQLDAQAAKL